jgi:hypothetical protein
MKYNEKMIEYNSYLLTFTPRTNRSLFSILQSSQSKFFSSRSFSPPTIKSVRKQKKNIPPRKKASFSKNVNISTSFVSSPFSLSFPLLKPPNAFSSLPFSPRKNPLPPFPSSTPNIYPITPLTQPNLVQTSLSFPTASHPYPYPVNSFNVHNPNFNINFLSFPISKDSTVNSNLSNLNPSKFSSQVSSSDFKQFAYPTLSVLPPYTNSLFSPVNNSQNDQNSQKSQNDQNSQNSQNVHSFTLPPFSSHTPYIHPHISSSFIQQSTYTPKK